MSIRKIFEANNKNLNSKPKYFQKLSMKYLEESLSIKSEEQIFYNLFLNLKDNLDDLIKKIIKKEEQKIISSNVLTHLPMLIDAHLGFKLIRKKDSIFYFQINKGLDSNEFIKINVQFIIEYFEQTCLIPKVQIIFKDINAWARFNKPEENFHLETQMNLLMSEQQLTKNKLVNSWGGWKFNGSDDYKNLEKCIIDIKNNLNVIYNYLNFYESNSLESLIKKYPLKKAISLADEFEQNGSVIYDLNRSESFFEVDFLALKKMFLMLYISFCVSRGEDPKAEKELFKSEIDKMNDKSKSKILFREVLEKINQEPQILFFRM